MDDMITLPDTSGALLAAIRELVDKIDNLDISVDYLAAAVTGQTAIEIGTDQSMLGRLASPTSSNLAPLSEFRLKQIIDEEYAVLLEEEAPQLTVRAANNELADTVPTDPNLVPGSFDLGEFEGLTKATSVGQNIGEFVSGIEDVATLGGALGAHVDLGGFAGGVGSQAHTTPEGPTSFQINVDLAKLMPENKLNKIIEEEFQRLLYESTSG